MRDIGHPFEVGGFRTDGSLAGWQAAAVKIALPGPWTSCQLLRSRIIHEFLKTGGLAREEMHKILVFDQDAYENIQWQW